MLHDSTRYSISICPECDDVIRKKLNIFDISARKGYTVNCGCQSFAWEIKEAKDRYRITVNCPACEDYHTYTISKRNFWGRKYFSFNCPNWEVGVLYFGNDQQYVENQMTAQSNNINDMLTQFMEETDDLELMYDLIECINDIAKAGKVTCGCNKTDVTVAVDDDQVVLTCKNCGRTKTIIPADNNIELLYETGTIVLDDTILF